MRTDVRCALVLGLLLVAGEASPAQTGSARKACLDRTSGRETRPSILVGRVLTPDGLPASGAVVVTSAGGEAVTLADGSFELAVDVPLGAECVEVTAALDAGARTQDLVARARILPAALAPITSVGSLLLAPTPDCNPRWLPTFGARRGTTGPVESLAVFDDGDGPSLYVGLGQATLEEEILEWDGSRWSPLGSGLDDGVFALTVHDDGGGPALYAGGAFDQSDGTTLNHVGRWNGTSWSALGSGVNGDVVALTTLDDGSGPALYAGGGFLTAGGQPRSRIARWDGATWSALGSGMDNRVEALAVFDDGDGPALYAGGLFTTAGGVNANRIAKWDGATWSALGSGMNDRVTALAVFDDGNGPALYAGGRFTTAGGAAANSVAKWNGSSWSALGTGITGSTADVFSLAVHDDGDGPMLCAAGLFTTAGGTTADSLARWSGTTWSALESDLGDLDGTISTVNVLASFDDGSGAILFAGGWFDTAGEEMVNYVAGWKGSAWSALGRGLGGPAPVVLAITAFDDGNGPALYVGGDFRSAGPVETTDIAKWDGSTWSALGSFTAGFFPTNVHTLAVYDDGGGPALHAGGWLGSPDRIAKWNGSTWSALGSGVNGLVHALAVFDDGSGPALFAGGSLTSAGGTPASRIARWNGSSWSALGSGTNGDVLALAVFDDGSGAALYAGGTFTTAGGVSANYVARWDGASWSALGTGTGGPAPTVRALSAFDDGSGPALYAGGNFTTAGGVSAARIARWDGTSWSALGSGMSDPVRALVVFDDGSGAALHAGGAFIVAGGVAANGIARWDGASWSPLGSGVNREVRALGVFDESGRPALCVGGLFDVSPAGDSFLGKWGCGRKVRRMSGELPGK